MNKDDQISTGLSPLFSEDNLEKEKKSNYSSEDEWKCHEKFITLSRFNHKSRVVDTKTHLYHQLFEDPLYCSCVPSQKHIVDYLISQNIGDIYDYLRQCNKQGILLDCMVNRYYQIKEPNIKYNKQQCYAIHQKNVDQRNLIEISADIEEIKKNKKFAKVERKTYKNFEFICDPVEERRRIREMRYVVADAPIPEINRDLYDVEALDVEIETKTIQDALLEYQQEYKKHLEDFEPTKKRVVLSDSDESEIINYNDISGDSLEEHFLEHPSTRDPQYRSMNFSLQITAIKITSKLMFVI